MSDVGIFVSFDVDHDGDLTERLVEESRRPGSGFRISARSHPGTTAASWDERVRRRIREADEVIVICGEHTDASVQVSAEVRIAQEEETPYFLLWGRRELMCTRPTGSRPGDSMYSWTAGILREQIGIALRKAQSQEPSDPARRP